MMKEQQGPAGAEATPPDFWNRVFSLGSRPCLPTEHHASVVHAHVGILGEKSHEYHGISKDKETKCDCWSSPSYCHRRVTNQVDMKGILGSTNSWRTQSPSRTGLHVGGEGASFLPPFHLAGAGPEV